MFIRCWKITVWSMRSSHVALLSVREVTSRDSRPTSTPVSSCACASLTFFVLSTSANNETTAIVKQKHHKICCWIGQGRRQEFFQGRASGHFSSSRGSSTSIFWSLQWPKWNLQARGRGRHQEISQGEAWFLAKDFFSLFCTNSLRRQFCKFSDF